MGAAHEGSRHSGNGRHDAGAEPASAGERGVVFWAAVLAAVVFVAFGLIATDTFNDALNSVVGQIIARMGWLYLLIVAGFFFFVIYLAVGRYGKIRLGRPGERPEYSNFSWFAMLFQAGMGIGLVFWSVSEPVLHYADPPLGMAAPKSEAAADLAMRYTMFHWGLHPWAIYAVVGVAVGYFSFRRGEESLRISTVLRPLIGDRVNGPIGQVVDILAIIATLFGIAVSLGSGTLQIDAGLGAAFGAPSGTGLQMGIIGVTAIAYMLSASTPIDRGVQFLSNASMVLAVVLVGYFIVVGPTLLELNTITQTTGGYLTSLVPMSTNTSAFKPDPWIGEWTVYFWSTWVAWAPYVGVFIARISRGRTIREFVFGVLAAPTLFTLLWFSVLGASGIDADRRTGGAVSEAAGTSAASALFTFLESFPLTLVISILAIGLVWIFFVAGADAGTIVLGSMSTGGAQDPSRPVKLTWGVIMGALAAILLLAGGLDALQAGAIIAATPFALIMLAICASLYKALAADARDARLAEEDARAARELPLPPRREQRRRMQTVLAGRGVGAVAAGRMERAEAVGVGARDPDE